MQKAVHFKDQDEALTKCSWAEEVEEGKKEGKGKGRREEGRGGKGRKTNIEESWIHHQEVKEQIHPKLWKGKSRL